MPVDSRTKANIIFINMYIFLGTAATGVLAWTYDAVVIAWFGGLIFLSDAVTLKTQVMNGMDRSPMALQAQDRRIAIHFLADTISVDAKDRVVDIGQEGGISYYAFYGNGISSDSSFVAFANYKTDPSPIITGVVPNFSFMSWKSFSLIVRSEGDKLHKRYAVYITEVLPGRKYKTAKVVLVRGRAKIEDYQIITGARH
jgi:hypothetical protein